MQRKWQSILLLSLLGGTVDQGRKDPPREIAEEEAACFPSLHVSAEKVRLLQAANWGEDGYLRFMGGPEGVRAGDIFESVTPVPCPEGDDTCVRVGLLGGICFEFLWDLEATSRPDGVLRHAGERVLDGNALPGDMIRAGYYGRGHAAMFGGYSPDPDCFIIWDENSGPHPGLVRRREVCGAEAGYYSIIPRPAP